MNKNEAVKDMAKILCPKGTANCEKCSKNYKCDVKFSQLAELFDGGCRIVGDDEIVVKKSEYDILLKDYALTYDNAYQWGLKVGEEKTAIDILQEVYDTFAKKAINGLPNRLYDDFTSQVVKIIAIRHGIKLED